MKQINVYFEDEEMKKLEEEKNNLSWHDFILTILDKGEKDG
jgi:hypothetical protein